MNQDEIKLLSRGPTFCPTPRKNTLELKTDIRILIKKIRQLEYFKDSNLNNFSNSYSLKNPSKFLVPPGRNKAVDNCCNFLFNLSDSLDNLDSQKFQNNLSKNEQNALQNLANNKNIIIKVVDKGGAFCILDKDYYIKLINEILEIEKTETFGTNSKTYTMCRQGSDENISKNLLKLLNKYPDIYSKDEIDYIYNFQHFPAQFYGLPKVHKSHIIQGAIKEQNSICVNIKCPNDLSLRPIVSGRQSATSHLSHAIEIILKPLLKHIHCDLEDELTFLSSYPKDIFKNDGVFITLDVRSMFTNIDLGLMMKAVKFWIYTFSESIESRYTQEFILEAISFLMSNNFFQFNGKLFRQKKGGAMGSECIPTLCRLSMGYLEYNKLFPSLEQKNPELVDYIKNYYIRYMDDGFLYLVNGIIDPHILLELFNNMHPSIKFDMNIQSSSISFLSLKLIRLNKKLSIDVFYKQSDSHAYLHFYSCHPRHTKTAVPFNLARRLNCIITNNDTLNDRLNEMHNFLKKRYYPEALIKNCFEKAKSLPKETLLNRKIPNENERTLNILTTYNTKNPFVNNFIRTALDLLKGDDTMRKILSSTKILWTNRQPSNLRRILCPSILNKPCGGSTKCKGPRCEICNILILCSEITFNNGKVFKISSKVSCNSKFCIYVLQCRCGLFYIGECEDFRARINLHHSQIRTPEYRNIKVVKHIFSCGHKFKATPIYLMSDESIIKRKTQEDHFIKIFEPELNC